MKNTFLSQTKDALRSLRRAQERRARHEAIAADRFGRAQVEYREKLALAAAVEGRAWKALQDVPGMTAQTAAALCGVSVATVNRRTKGVSNG
jgi:DNA-directed RNA polymerase specialized sigma24 family protein